MTLSKNAFRSRLILARKLAHEQIVDQDKRLVWTSLQLQSLIFPVLVVFILSYIWFSFYLDLFPSDTIGFSFLVDFLFAGHHLQFSSLFFFVGHPSIFPFVIYCRTPSVLYIFFCWHHILESLFHCWWFSSFLPGKTKLHGGYEIMNGFSLLNWGKDRGR